MKRLFTIAGLALVLVGGSMWSADADAKRLGGGRSSGMQRDSVTQRQSSPDPAGPATAPRQNAAQPGQPGQTAQAAAVPGAVGAAAGAAPKRSWLGPVAGLAAGLGLAALASHLGFGEELASFLLIALAVTAAVVVFRLLFRHKAQPGMQYAAAGPAFGGPAKAPQPEMLSVSGRAAAAPLAPEAAVPADFDVEGFLRNAKLNFVRLQAANDRGDLQDIREFTSPEMFAEIRLQLEERGKSAQQTDVVTLQAELLDVTEETNRYVVSVRFGGLIREVADSAPTTFSEVWHLTKPKDGSRGWVVAGIQQSH